MTSRFSDSPSLLALFGGTFDPIHYGHLRPAEALAQEIGLKHIYLLPNHIPPHRPQPEANEHQRLQMLKLAIAGNPLFSIDQRELTKNSPSYTLNTLAEIRQEQGSNQPLAFIIGQDSLLTLHRWQGWQHLLDYSHLLVCARPGYRHSLDTPELNAWLTQHLCSDHQQLTQEPHGYIYLAQTPLLDISATDIRKRQRGGLACHDLLPDAVEHYIRQQGLYR